MRNLMISERMTLGGVVELAQRATHNHLVQIGWIGAAIAMPELWQMDELVWGGLQAMFLVVGRCVTKR